MKEQSEFSSIKLIAVLLTVLCLFAGCADEKASCADLMKLNDKNISQLLSGCENYFACVQEVIHDGGCAGMPSDPPCPVRVRIVKYICGKGAEGIGDGFLYETMEARSPYKWPNRRTGVQRLVISVPSGKFKGKFVSKLFIPSPSSEEIEILQSLIEKFEKKVGRS